MLTPDQIAALILRGRAYRAQLVAALTAQEYTGNLNVNWSKPEKISHLIQALNFCLAIADYSSTTAIQVYDNLSQFLGNAFLTGVSIDPNIQLPYNGNVTIINQAGYIDPIPSLPWSSLDSATQNADGNRSIYYNPAWNGYNPILSLTAPIESALNLGTDYNLVSGGGIVFIRDLSGNGSPGIADGQFLRVTGYVKLS